MSAQILRLKDEVRNSRWLLAGGLLLVLGSVVVVRVVGLLFVLLFFISGVSMIVSGARISQRWRCSDCHGLLGDRVGRLCPHCGAVFED